jgi:creatinine amidohydrolase
MRMHDANWMQIEQYLEADDRIVLPLGSTEQHGYLSLGTDAILAERISLEAAEPLGVPVAPALPFGLVPYFAAFPGSPTLRTATYLEVLRDLLDSLHGQGFRRFLLVNGHGGNTGGAGIAPEWTAANPGGEVLWHDWWRGPDTWTVAQRIDPEGAHANWMENLPWTRLPGVELPDRKPSVAAAELRTLDPAHVRELLGDGSYGGAYSRPDEQMLELWSTGVTEVRALLEGGWRER